ncbi:hypothetical protein NP233_g12528 [Leucocoprinus birnbaumii]|uniref:Uncharacterized protein n=1 Tax=Leucocoprinus birnbaumii TaxID=56174 RepID=A0AAD5VE99_9AGAR|nr:hypothetical protein NP233_g12528 [Leucocoprinus birnbaumii]
MRTVLHFISGFGGCRLGYDDASLASKRITPKGTPHSLDPQALYHEPFYACPAYQQEPRQQSDCGYHAMARSPRDHQARLLIRRAAHEVPEA